VTPAGTAVSVTGAGSTASQLVSTVSGAAGSVTGRAHGNPAGDVGNDAYSHRSNQATIFRQLTASSSGVRK
jgi:hypothetical protein